MNFPSINHKARQKTPTADLGTRTFHQPHCKIAQGDKTAKCTCGEAVVEFNPYIFHAKSRKVERPAEPLNDSTDSDDLEYLYKEMKEDKRFKKFYRMGNNGKLYQVIRRRSFKPLYDTELNSPASNVNTGAIVPHALNYKNFVFQPNQKFQSMSSARFKTQESMKVRNQAIALIDKIKTRNKEASEKGIRLTQLNSRSTSKLQTKTGEQIPTLSRNNSQPRMSLLIKQNTMPVEDIITPKINMKPKHSTEDVLLSSADGAYFSSTTPHIKTGAALVSPPNYSRVKLKSYLSQKSPKTKPVNKYTDHILKEFHTTMKQELQQAGVTTKMSKFERLQYFKEKFPEQVGKFACIFRKARDLTTKSSVRF